MRAIRQAHAVAALVAVLAGCTSPPATPASDTTAATPAATPAAWYLAARALDLTGDGRPDSIRLEAHGPRPDSLRVVLTLVVDGRERHHEEWGSSYELAMADSALRLPPHVDAYLRARLDSVLARVAVQRLDDPGVRLMAEDSAALRGVVPRPTHRVSIAYGYETTARLAWDAPRNRFVKLWSCC